MFGHWGMTETGYGGAVTAEPDGSYLLRRDLFAEVIDPLTGKCLPEGSVGEIVITTVGREGMPLLRYRTGDRGRLHRDENGRQALSGLEGRLSDAVRLPDGTNISIHILDEIFYNEPDLVYYEAGLSAEGTLRIGWQGTECAGDGLPAESLPFRLRARLGAAFGGIRATFYPAAFRTGKRSLKTEGDLT